MLHATYLITVFIKCQIIVDIIIIARFLTELSHIYLYMCTYDISYGVKHTIGRFILMINIIIHSLSAPRLT